MTAMMMAKTRIAHWSPKLRFPLRNLLLALPRTTHVRPCGEAPPPGHTLHRGTEGLDDGLPPVGG